MINLLTKLYDNKHLPKEEFLIFGSKLLCPNVYQNKQIKRIEEIVCKYYHLNPCLLQLKTRKAMIVRTRKIVCYLVRLKHGITFRDIGEYYNLSSSNVVHLTKDLVDYMEFDKDLTEEINELRSKINTV